MGRSGSGKGTQADLIMKLLKELDPSRGVIYLQTGQELRQFIGGSSYTEKLAKEIYDVGGLMPEFVAIYCWVKAIVERYTGNEHFVFDGAARKLPEAEIFGSVFSYYKLPKPWVVNVVVSREEATRRLLDRKRSDDNKEEIEKRLAWFDTDVMPAIDLFKKDSRFNYIEVDGEKSREEIHEEIVKKVHLG